MDINFQKKYSVKLSQIVAEHSLRVVYAAPDFATKLVNSVDLNRPGMQLMGYMKHFDASRLQVIGKAETNLMTDYDHLSRLRGFEAIMSTHVPAIIIAHNQPILPECLEVAQHHQVTILSTDLDTMEFYAQLIGTLRRYLAPRETIHGVLVEVHGEGMLITGDSGIGKSETALELIKRGHRLIADDAVELIRTSRSTLEGRAPAVIKHFMELRGIGVVNVPSVYGIGAVKNSCPIDMVIALELWDQHKQYDRLGVEQSTTEYLGVSVPFTTIPVHPGRNLAVILELAAMINRQRRSGYNAAEELTERIDHLVDSGTNY